MSQTSRATPSPAEPAPPKRKRGGSEPGRRYDSAVMQGRRARILTEAQALLSEVGIEAFTINELSRRAEVAQRTLYRNLGSREDIIARAITAHYDGLLAGIPPFKGRTLQDYLERARTMGSFVVGLRSYASAMVAVYFSPTVDRRIFDGLRAIALRGYGNIFEDAAEAGIFRKLNAGERLMVAHRMPYSSYGLVSDWAAGRLTDEQYMARVPVSFLLSTHPFLTDAARAEADTMIAAHAAVLAAERD